MSLDRTMALQPSARELDWFTGAALLVGVATFALSQGLSYPLFAVVERT